MSAPELRATVSLAAIFALRMLGLFMIMPVFSVYAKTIPGGDNVLLVGIALGAYGVTQSLLYIFYGWVSDKIGRKPVIATGLVIFALGSFVAAFAHDMTWIIVGRVIQGMGAVSSAVIAFIADLTAEEIAPRPWPWWAAVLACRSRWRLSARRSCSSGSA